MIFQGERQGGGRGVWCGRRQESSNILTYFIHFMGPVYRFYFYFGRWTKNGHLAIYLIYVVLILSWNFFSLSWIRHYQTNNFFYYRSVIMCMCINVIWTRVPFIYFFRYMAKYAPPHAIWWGLRHLWYSLNIHYSSLILGHERSCFSIIHGIAC